MQVERNQKKARQNKHCKIIQIMGRLLHRVKDTPGPCRCSMHWMYHLWMALWHPVHACPTLLEGPEPASRACYEAGTLPGRGMSQQKCMAG